MGRRMYSDEERVARRRETQREYRRKQGKVARTPRRGDAANCEIEFSDEEREFLMAVDRYKAGAGVHFPTLTQLLAVLKSLGYRKPGV
jgi:hypothetical protein